MRVFIYGLTSLCFFFLIAQQAFAGGSVMISRTSGFYLTADIGGATLQQQHSNSNLVVLAGGVPVAGAILINQIDARDGFNFTGTAGLGWQFSHLFRMDFTYTYLRFPMIIHDFDTDTVGGGGDASVMLLRGCSSVYLLNAYINLASLFGHNTYKLYPYIGAGIGWANNRTNNSIVTGNITPIFVGSLSNAYRSDFVYRVMAGFVFPLVKGLQLFTQYSYLCAGKYEAGTQFVTNSGSGIFVVPLKFRIHSNIFSAGLIYLF